MPSDGKNEPVHPLVVGELIDDRALTERSEDLLGLNHFVDEVADLVEHAPVPANIALFGSWGSGKTSLSNLLGSEVPNRSGLRFARFDAFKYAEIPLRRHFLSQIAQAFQLEDERFHADLYRSTSSNTIQLPKGSLRRLGLLALASLLGIAGFVALVGLLGAWISGGPFGKTYVDILKSSLTGVLLSIPLVTGILALAGKALTVTGSRAAPSGEEEFERLFRQLVKAARKKHGASRLVIFIDELDRCSPSQVVSVLETLRTFLEVPPCVFVVAADKHVLERALSEEARQATPADPTNPYYSAGSAYLDKVFQYQMDLPPLLPRRLTEFALTLIKDRPGTWSRLSNRAEVVSVLVPTHVRSPRRVKVLLNNFALTYRLAGRRAEAGMLEAEVSARESELAKLVCLRTEFPLFANDLALDHRLPDYVLLLAENPQADVGTLGRPRPSDQTVALAGAYAAGRLPVDEVLSGSTPARRTSDETIGPEPEEEVPEEEGSEHSEAAAADESLVVQTSHSQQLIRYLRRTREIRNPGRDIVFMEGPGVAFGLDSRLAEQLETDAVDGQAETVGQSVADMSAEEQFAAYRFLARVVTESLGIEAANATSGLLHSLSFAKKPLTPVADDLMSAVLTYGPKELEAKDLAGALLLAVEGGGPRANALADAILQRDEVLTEEALSDAVIRFAAELFDVDSGRVGEVVAMSIGQKNPDDLLGELSRLSEERLAECVQLGNDTLRLPLDEITAQETGVEDSDRPLKERKAEYCQTIADFGLKALTSHGRRVTVSVTDVLLGFDTTEGRNAAETLLDHIQPIEETSLIVKVITSTRPRTLESWPTWLGSLSPAAVTATDETVAPVESLVTKLWLEAIKASPPADEAIEAAVASLRTSIGQQLETSSAEVAENLDAQTVGSVSEAGIDERRRRLRILRRLTDERLLAGHIGASVVTALISATLRTTFPSPPSAALGDFLVDTLIEWSDHLSEEQLTEIKEGIEASPWLDDRYSKALALQIAVVEKDAGREPSYDPEASELGDLVGEGASLDRALAQWALVFKPTAAAVWNLLSNVPDRSLPEDHFRSALSRIATDWSAEDKGELLKEFGPAFLESLVDEQLARTLRLHEADERTVLAELKELFDVATNNRQRERILILWDLLDPKGEAVRRKLVDAVYLPLLEKGKGALEIAIDHFRVVQHIPGVRRRIRQALLDATADDRSLRRRAQKAMGDAGWMRRRFGIFGRYEDVDAES